MHENAEIPQYLLYEMVIYALSILEEPALKNGRQDAAKLPTSAVFASQSCHICVRRKK